MLNQIILMGRLTRDPELRRTNSGIPVTTFTLAVDRDFGKEGEEKEVDFIDVATWRNTAEFVSKYFTKGRMAAVVGRLQIRNWTDKDGNKRRSSEVVAENVYFADSKKEQTGFNYQDGVDRMPKSFPMESEPTFPDMNEPTNYAVVDGDDNGLPF